MSDHQPSRRAWLVVLVLFAGSVLNYVDRSVLGVVKPHLQRDLSLNNVEYGLAVNSFLISYSVLYILGGRLADRFGYRRMFPINAAFWSVACMLHSLARGLGSLCLFRGLLGVGEGGFYPSAIRGTSELFSPEERAKPVGVLMCGLSIGALITPPIVAWITYHYGWRSAFAMTGAAGLLLIPAWELLQRGTVSMAPAKPQASRAGILTVLTHRKYVFLLLARAITDAVWTFYLFWTPGYFQEERGFDLRAVGMLLWIPFLCADIGALAGGWASSGLIRKGWSINRSRKTVLFIAATLGILGVLVPGAPSAGVALALVGAVLFGQLAWTSNIHTALTEVAPEEHVSLLYGIAGAAGNSLGALAQPLIGRAVDTSGYGPAFLWAGLTYVAAIAFIAAMGRIEPIKRGTA